MIEKAFLFYNAFGYKEDEQDEQMIDEEIIIDTTSTI